MSNVNVTVSTNIAINENEEERLAPHHQHSLGGVFVWWGQLFIWAIQTLQTLCSEQRTAPARTIPSTNKENSVQEKEDEEEKNWHE